RPTRPRLGTVPTGRRKNRRVWPPFLSRDGVENGHGDCSRQPAATMDARVTTATLLSSAQGCQRPMLLLHGFLATPRVVGWLAGRLSRLGHCPRGVDLGGLFGRFNPLPAGGIAWVLADPVGTP